jgi:hypothetical protein
MGGWGVGSGPLEAGSTAQSWQQGESWAMGEGWRVQVRILSLPCPTSQCSMAPLHQGKGKIIFWNRNRQ